MCVFLHQLCSCDSGDTADLFSNDFPRAETTGLVTGMAGSKTSLMVVWHHVHGSWSCSSSWMRLPCDCGGTALGGQSQTFGSPCKGSVGLCECPAHRAVSAEQLPKSQSCCWGNLSRGFHSGGSLEKCQGNLCPSGEWLTDCISMLFFFS